MNEFDEEELKKYKRYIDYIIKNNEEEQIEDISWDNINKKTEYKLFKICNSICERKIDTLELHYWRLIRLYIISLSILISLNSKDDANLYEIKSIIHKIRYYLDYLGSNLDKSVVDRDIGLDSTDDISELDENRKVLFDFLYHLPIEIEFNAKIKKKYKLMYILLDLNYSLIDSELLDNKEDILSNILELDIIENSDYLIQNIKQYLEFYDDNYKYLIPTSGGSNIISRENISNNLIKESVPIKKTTIAERRVFSGLLVGITGAIFFSPPVNITAFLLGFLYAGWYESDMYGERKNTFTDKILNYIEKEKIVKK